MTLRKITTLMIASGLVVGLMGAGISAQFTDSATAGMTISVGTFNVNITSTTPGAVVVNTPTTNTITYAGPPIQSSAPDSAPLAFTVTSTGSIEAAITVTTTAVAAPFSDILGTVTPFTLRLGESRVFNAGLQWTQLFNADLGTTRSITYTITAAG